MGISFLFTLVTSGVPFGAAITATYGGIFGGLIKLAASALLNAGINAVFGPKGGTQQQVRQSISQQTELPFKRHVRGRAFATGTPSPGVAIGGFYYVAYLLNSRESEGNFEVYLDDRVLQVTGDPYDFTGSGATATNGLFSGHVQYWIQRGEKTAPPTVFTTEAGYDAADATLAALGYKATDAAQGCTVVWLKLTRGTDGTFQDRWPAYPYVNCTVLGDWSKVWDPRDTNQTATDESTHTFSRNAALHGLDLAMRNPFRPYGSDTLDLDAWIACADVDDETVALKSGGSEPRHRCGGTTLFDGSELEALMAPVTEANGSTLVRSGGRLGIVPNAPKNIAATIGDMISLPSVSTIAEPEKLFDEMHVTYTPLERDGAPASLRPWPIPGVAGAGLPRVLSRDFSMVQSATQAMRLRKVIGLKTTYTRTLDGTAWPELFEVVAGSWVTTSLGYSKLDGTFEVASIAPMAAPVNDAEGIAYRMPISLVETSTDIHVWDPFVDEEEVDIYEYVYDEEGVKTGGPISITTGDTVNLDTGGGIIPRVRFAFDPSDSPNISAYQVQIAVQGDPYSESVTVDPDALDGSGQIFGFFQGISGQPYDLRVRAISSAGFSDFVEFLGATPIVDITLAVPVFVNVSGGPSRINVNVDAPNDAGVRSIEVLESDTNDVTTATLFFEAASSQNQNFQPRLLGLGDDVTKYIFARVRGDFGSASAYVSDSATTDP